MSKLDELEIYGQIKDMVMREVKALSMKLSLSAAEMAHLEKLTKIYSVLKDDLREDIKADLWRKLLPQREE